MLKVQQFLQSNSLENLNNYYGIRHSIHEDGRVILNYDQIESSKVKTEDIVRECRALVLEKDSWNLISRSFYRFFNWGEYPHDMKKFQFNGSILTHKEDGSLLNVFNRNDKWFVHTRGSFGEGLVNDFISWRYLFELAAPNDIYKTLNPSYSYAFELCSLYNQVVRRYPTPTLFLLGVFQGEIEVNHSIVELISKEIKVNCPKTTSANDILDATHYIQNIVFDDKTFEGLVLRDLNNIRIKLKSEEYLMLHRMANNGNIQSESRLIEYILKGELDEVICYFPYVEKQARALEEKLQKIMETMSNHWYCFKDEKSRKKFALAIKDCPFNNFLFEAKTKHDNGETDINPITLMRASPEKVTRVL